MGRRLSVNAEHQPLRERNGLAYSVYAFSTGFSDAGMFGAYAGCLPDKVEKVVELAAAGLDDVARNGLQADELARAKGQAKGSMVLGLEDTGSRMSRIGSADLTLGELPSIDESLARIDAVSLESIAALAAELLSAPRALTVIGPVEDGRTFDLG